MKILKFSAIWCAPCKQLSNILSEMDVPHDIESVDVSEDINKPLVGKYGIRSVPVMIHVDDKGKELSRLNGMRSEEEIQDWFDKLV